MLDVLIYSINLGACCWLAYAPATVLSSDYPVHTVVLALAITTVLLPTIWKKIGKSASKDANEYVAVPLRDLNEPPEKSSLTLPHVVRRPLESWKSSLLLCAAVVVLPARIEVFRRIQANISCTSSSIEVFLPTLIAIYDAIRFQNNLYTKPEDEIDMSAYDAARHMVITKYLNHKWRYVPPALLLSVGCHMVCGLWAITQSTYICPVATNGIEQLYKLQKLALVCDLILAVSIYELSLNAGNSSRPFLAAPFSWTIISTSAAAVWAMVAAVVYRYQPEHVPWMLLREHLGSSASIFALLAKALFLSVVVTSSLLSISNFGLLHTSMLTSGLLVTIPGIVVLWSSGRPTPASTAALTWSFVFVYVAWSVFRRIERSLEPAEVQPSFSRRAATFVLFIVLIFPGLNKTDTVHFHPIDLLMYDAQKQFNSYISTAASSRTIQEAVATYRQRYNDHPPPGFDVWFEFARNRSVTIRDEFDQIYRDLLPFRMVDPKDIRTDTWELVSNPWNEISGITIRNGRADVQKNVLPTHRWMLEGVAVLINTFAEHLPDMDLAFNLNDESRIAMHHADLAALEQGALSKPFTTAGSWSNDRALGWKDVPEEDFGETVMENWSLRNTYHEWGIAGCSKDSIRTSKPLSRGHLCVDCAAPHSLGQFVSNWSKAADPCHQPDLAELHGFYASPAAFKSTHKLRPVFSQSKAHGYNDILYPSAWNYMDKVKYEPKNATGTPGEEGYYAGSPDPPFSEKQNVLYWRGATSEGVSHGTGTWRGMVRQRLVHMGNNYTSSEHDRVTVLLPNSRHPGKYTYTSMPGTAVKGLGLNTDMLFVDHIARCGGSDCPAQEQEFLPQLTHASEFQDHWQYRFLFDADGAAFSGRFLPFLQSRSLPFKTALFREWYDSRLIPWLHFVPQDLRLHGLWSTLAYFAGIDGTDHQGNRVIWKGHMREAGLIAEAGRTWVEEALRKEDMEVYFFRLLLEWARLTDDRRDSIGFDGV